MRSSRWRPAQRAANKQVTWWAVAGAVVLISVPARSGRAQSAGLKVYISADMEGIGGVVTRQQTGRGQAEYEGFRELMTAEVNAAVEAAKEAGASEIVVSDSHGSGQNLLVQKLHPDARLVRAFPRALDMMHGIDASFAAAVFIGYHAAEWQPGILAHTMDGNLTAIRLNGTTVGEPGFSAAIAGHFGVPVALIAGDQVAVAELKALVPDVEGAEVKQAYGRTSALSLHPSRAQRLIKERTRAALSRIASLKPYRVETPITMDLSFKNQSTAEVVAMIPTVERTAPNAVRVVLPDMLAAARFIGVVMHLRVTPEE
jgi:D-amino peptidase